jgi:hypothetical protein
MKELLIKLNACNNAQKWATGKSWKEIYETCHRGDWLLWLFYKTMNHESEEDFTLLTHAKGHCANTVRHLMKDIRSTNAVDAAIGYSGDRVVLKQVAADAYAAYAADADANYAAYAAYAAAAADARIQNQLDTANIVRQWIPIDKWHIDVNLLWE